MISYRGIETETCWKAYIDYIDHSNWLIFYFTGSERMKDKVELQWIWSQSVKNRKNTAKQLLLRSKGSNNSPPLILVSRFGTMPADFFFGGGIKSSVFNRYLFHKTRNNKKHSWLPTDLNLQLNESEVMPRRIL